MAKTDPLGLSLAAVKHVGRDSKVGTKGLESEVVARELGTALRTLLN